ncbi:MAG: hypothetical protein ACXABY_12690 [Candidatus Thorarchaeota archaeon]|jgi:hypothetical protein
MKTRNQWKVHRSAIEREDGQQRWDEAYQFLLHCMMENREKALDEKTCEEQEEQNGSCTLCPCFNHTATTGSDH